MNTHTSARTSACATFSPCTSYTSYLQSIAQYPAICNAELLVMQPVLHTKIWGGHQIEQEFGYDVPAGKIGEAWVIGAHPAGDCVLASGPYAAHTLSHVYAEHPELFGDSTNPAHPQPATFPLLVKIIDAHDDLSIQVHPNDEYAALHENGSRGKSECWYVLKAEPGATIIVGQHAQTKEAFARAVREGAWSELLYEVPVHEGDFFQIEPGRVHAIKNGTLLLETQQSSDITYRVYDYDRKQDDGTLRTLHMKQSLDTIDFTLENPTSGSIPAGNVVYTPDGSCSETTLICSPFYTVKRLILTQQRTLTLHKSWPFLCISVVRGSGTIQGVPVIAGTHMILTARASQLACCGDMCVIVSHIPC